MIILTEVMIWTVAIGITIAFYFLWKRIKVYEEKINDLEEKLNYESAAITRLNDTMDSKIEKVINGEIMSHIGMKEPEVETVSLRKRKGKK